MELQTIACGHKTTKRCKNTLSNQKLNVAFNIPLVLCLVKVSTPERKRHSSGDTHCVSNPVDKSFEETLTTGGTNTSENVKRAVIVEPMKRLSNHTTPHPELNRDEIIVSK